MLEGIFGNDTAGKILLYIYHHGEGYALGISSDLKLSNTSVVNQLNRLEKAQILISKNQGRTRVYSFNERYPLTKPVKEIIKIQYEGLGATRRSKLFKKRRRPRMKGKAIVE